MVTVTVVVDGETVTVVMSVIVEVLETVLIWSIFVVWVTKAVNVLCCWTFVAYKVEVVVTVVVCSGREMVLVDGRTPMHEHADLYWLVLQDLAAYAGGNC